MSVLVTMRAKSDTDQFRRFIATEGDRLREIAQSARDAGAIHHRFGVGDGFVVVVDEWDTAESFQRFISSDRLPAACGGGGGGGGREGGAGGAGGAHQRARRLPGSVLAAARPELAELRLQLGEPRDELLLER